MCVSWDYPVGKTHNQENVTQKRAAEARLDAFWKELDENIKEMIDISILEFIQERLLEDRTLQAELPGYTDYARRVRYRLMPGLY